MSKERFEQLLLEKQMLTELLKIHHEYEAEFSMTKAELEEYTNEVLDRILEINEEIKLAANSTDWP